jgi:dihydrofolate reductase
MITLVAAMGRNRVIGREGHMPWHLPADLYRFRRLTKGNVVVMGRKTYESIGGPLDERINYVLTRDASYEAPGCEVVHAIDAILEMDGPVYVIGGGELYRQFLPLAGELRLTRIDAEFDGDRFFPAWDEAEWELVETKTRPKDERNAYDLTFEVYRRRQA